MSSMRYPASSDIISASLLQGDTAVCFLRAREIGINVCDPNTEHHPKLTLRPSNFLQNRRLGKSQFAVYRLLPNVTILSVVGRVMNVTDETCLSLIARSVPFCDWSDQVIQCPKWMWPSNACQVQAFLYHLRARFWQFSHNFQIIFHKLVIVLTRCGNLVELVNRLVRHFATAFNTLLAVTFHVTAPSCDVLGICLFGFDTILLWSCAARRVHPRYTWSVNDTGSSKPTCFLQFCSTSSACNCILRWTCRHSHPGTSSHPSSS